MPEGFKPVGSVASGLVVAVPEDWIALDLSKDDLEQGLRSSGLSGPGLERAKQSLQTLVDNRAVWASDPASTRDVTEQVRHQPQRLLPVRSQDHGERADDLRQNGVGAA